jgi:hypothetical protein
MKKKIIIFLLLAITSTTGFARGLYSTEEDVTRKEGFVLFDSDDDMIGDPDWSGTGGVGDVGTDDIPIREGVLLLTALSGIYLLIGHQTKRTR